MASAPATHSTSVAPAAPAVPRTQNFDRRVEETKPSKRDIDLVIMDYLINQGYPTAAKKFADEANIPPSQCSGDMEYIRDRVEIKEAIMSGKIQHAIECINELDPELLDTRPALHFSLLRLQLLELIKESGDDPTPALQFAETQLGPRAPTDPSFLRDLEQTMALLIFSPDNLSKDLAALLKPDLRHSVANSVNEAILENLGYRRTAKLYSLAKLRVWAEKQARSNGVVRAGLPEKMSIWGTDNSGDTVMGGEDNSNGVTESFTSASS